MNDNNFGYSKKISTTICYEKPSTTNPYIAESISLHGYDLFELTQKKSFLEVLLLLNTGSLPSSKDVELLNALMIGLINLGPRNPAIRAAMTAGISKTNVAHILPIGLMVLGGSYNGANEVEKSMQFIQKNLKSPPEEVAKALSQKHSSKDKENSICPGIGSTFGGKDLITCKLAEHIGNLSAVNKAFNWLNKLINSMDDDTLNWRPSGLAAAVLLDLGIAPREGAALYQLICSPGIIAHGLEQTHKPVRSMPFLEDSQYDYQK